MYGFKTCIYNFFFFNNVFSNLKQHNTAVSNSCLKIQVLLATRSFRSTVINAVINDYKKLPAWLATYATVMAINNYSTESIGFICATIEAVANLQYNNWKIVSENRM